MELTRRSNRAHHASPTDGLQAGCIEARRSGVYHRPTSMEEL
jgi:hypothetical protein